MLGIAIFSFIGRWAVAGNGNKQTDFGKCEVYIFHQNDERAKPKYDN